MNETSTCLSITEKRPHKPTGGCVGIFFQLFDWNRRFAKKKLFSRKLLPPAPAKQASKKFGGDEKMPKTKLHLIADENTGGFPNVKKNGVDCVDLEPKHETRTPSLVARLMGLESMPAVRKDKNKKPSISGSCYGTKERVFNDHNVSTRQDLNLGKVSAKVESRPQKLQKTEQYEGRAVTRFGAETLQIKSVLSRSRKHHHPKLAAPMKSPRISSGRNASRTSRLIDAASKILEPGLQATSRAKCALTYSSSTRYTTKYEVLTEAGEGVVSPDLSKQSGHNVCGGKSMMGQTCRNCGNFLDVVDSRNMEEQAFVHSSSGSNLVNVYSPGLGKSKPRPTMSINKEREMDFQKGHQSMSRAAPVKDNNSIRSSSVASPDRVPPSQGQTQWHSTSQQTMPQKQDPSSFTFKQRNQTQNRMSLGRDRIPPRAKSSNMQGRRVSSAANTVSGVKDFVALNRSLSGGCSRPRIPAKLDNSSCNAEGISCNQQDVSLSQLRTPVRKRRTTSVSGQVESAGSVNSRLGRQRNVRCNVPVKEIGLNVCSMDQTSIKNRGSIHGNSDITNENRITDVISFTFNSPLRHKTGISTEMKDNTEDEVDFISKSTCQRKLMDENNGGPSLRNQLPLSGDALGALLEEKLKELTSQEEDESSAPKRSTALILQELISALTVEQPMSQDGPVFNTDIAFQTKTKAKETSVVFARDGDHLSPGSVLDASFSNDSWFSSSLDSGRRLHLDFTGYFHDHPQATTKPDADLLDSATSLNKRSAGHQIVNNLVTQVSRLLHNFNYGHLGLSINKQNHANDVILNTELLFGNASLQNSGGMRDFLVAPFLLAELEILASAMSPFLKCVLGFEETKQGNQLMGFLLDCLIECFDTKYSRYCNSGFKAWTRLPLRMKAEMLTREVGEEVIKWTHFAGMTPDEIIECDMSHSLGKWIDFDIEAFETGAEIGQDILQILVEEIVIDICKCRLAAF